MRVGVLGQGLGGLRLKTTFCSIFARFPLLLEASPPAFARLLMVLAMTLHECTLLKRCPLSYARQEKSLFPWFFRDILDPLGSVNACSFAQKTIAKNNRMHAHVWGSFGGFDGELSSSAEHECSSPTNIYIFFFDVCTCLSRVPWSELSCITKHMN